MTDQIWKKNAENRSFRHFSHIDAHSLRSTAAPLWN